MQCPGGTVMVVVHVLVYLSVCVCLCVVFLLYQGHIGRRSVHLLRTRPLLSGGSSYSGNSVAPMTCGFSYL